MTVRSPFTTDTRGTSNTLGYALTFSVIIISILFIITSGVASLDSAREITQTNNAFRAMDILTTNIEDVYRWGAPSRGTELKLGGGDLQVGRESATSVRIDVDNPNTGTTFNHSTSFNTFVYTTPGGAKAIYDGGLVIREPDSVNADPVVVERPPISFSEARTGISLLNIRGDGNVGGETTTLVVAEHESSRLVYQNSTTQADQDLNVTIQINSTPTKATAWSSYLESEGLTAIDGDGSDGSVEYYYETDRIYIRGYTIEISFEN